jgi:hypothetical protein
MIRIEFCFNGLFCSAVRRRRLRKSRGSLVFGGALKSGAHPTDFMTKGGSHRGGAPYGRKTPHHVTQHVHFSYNPSVGADLCVCLACTLWAGQPRRVAPTCKFGSLAAFFAEIPGVCGFLSTSPPYGRDDMCWCSHNQTAPYGRDCKRWCAQMKCTPYLHKVN